MSIKDQLTADMKQAMKDREAGKLRLSVIRMVRANIKGIGPNFGVGLLHECGST